MELIVGFCILTWLGFRILRFGGRNCCFRSPLHCICNKIHRLLKSCPDTDDETLFCLPMFLCLDHSFPRGIICPQTTIHIPSSRRRNVNSCRREKPWCSTRRSCRLPYGCLVFIKPIRFEEFERSIGDSTVRGHDKDRTT